MTNYSFQALIPNLIPLRSRKALLEAGFLITGVLAISLLAQVSIPLPGTPIPITGQTLGVALVSLSWGRKRAINTLLAYLALGALGLPIFAFGASGLFAGPSLGYLLGMLVASFIMGALADYGFTKTFSKSLLAAMSGSLVTFTFGIIGLSFFLSFDKLLVAGVLPFLPGDFLKNLIAASMSKSLRTYFIGEN